MTQMREENGVMIGSDNVFADLGLPDPEGLLAQAKMIHAITQAVAARGLSDAELAGLIGLDEAGVDELLSGPSDEFSLNRLAGILNALGQDVTITIRERAEGAGRLLVEAA